MSLHSSNDSPQAMRPNTEPTEPSGELAAWLPRLEVVVLVCDVVESVRWMEHDEDNAISRWSQFAHQVREQMAPAHEGRVVKSTGDGLMIEFKHAPQAVAAAHALHSLAQEGNQRLAAQDPERQLHLRIGIHQAEVRRDAHDLYGHGVNLAARITSLAGPGEIVVTPQVRDHITHSLDGEIEDMGECYLKHLSEPQRVYRIDTRDKVGITRPATGPGLAPLPSLAVMSFESRSSDQASVAVGELIADTLTVVLSRSNRFQMRSRLSLRQIGKHQIDSAKSRLNCDFMVHGSFLVLGSVDQGELIVTLQLEDTAQGELVFAQQYRSNVAELLSCENTLAQTVAADINKVISQHAIQLVVHHPAPNIPSYALHMGAVKMMHHTSKTDFARSKSLLELLSDRFPRWSQPYSWLAKWQMLSVEQGWAEDPRKSSAIAKDMASRAIDQHYDDAMAHTVQGIVNSNLLHDLPAAMDCYDRALSIDSNEPLAWLSRGMACAFAGDGKRAIAEISHAHQLSPLDPLAYYYTSLLSSAYLTDNQFEQAIHWAQRSLKLNALHASTLRVLTIASMLSGDTDGARRAASRLLKVSPSLTVNGYLSRAPASGYVRAQEFARALGAAGVPQH